MVIDEIFYVIVVLDTDTVHTRKRGIVRFIAYGKDWSPKKYSRHSLLGGDCDGETTDRTQPVS